MWLNGHYSGSINESKKYGTFRVYMQHNNNKWGKSFNSYDEAKIYQMNESDQFGLTKNKYRNCEIHYDCYEVKCNGPSKSFHVSKQDIEMVRQYIWYSHSSKRHHTDYISAKCNKKQIQLHRVILGLKNSKQVCDHNNGDGTDNRRINLKNTTQQMNANNRRRKHVNNKTGVTGVYERVKLKMFVAKYIDKDGNEHSKAYSYGSKSTREEAFNMAVEWRNMYKPHYNINE